MSVRHGRRTPPRPGGSSLLLLLKAATCLFLLPAAAAAQAVTLPDPALVGSLTFSPQPPSVQTGAFGTWYVDGVVSGLGLVQSQAVAGDRAALLDASNAQVFVQKVDGLVQFYVQAGAYAIPELGTAYGRTTDAASTWGRLYTAVPQAYLKLAPWADFSIEAGRLPTLIGPEDNFTFENYNIARGLLWNQEPSVSRGVQANLTLGPVLLNLSLNDGYYSGRFNWVSGEATWTLGPSSTVVLDGAANLGRTGTNSFATPLALDNSAIFNLAYTYKHGKLTVTPYLQYSQVNRNTAVGILGAAAATSGAVIANYAFTRHVDVAVRGEHVATSASRSAPAATNLLYGAGSGATSLTLTPALTFGRYFARVEASVVVIDGLVAGDGFGQAGRGGAQVRGMLETGIIF